MVYRGLWLHNASDSKTIQQFILKFEESWIISFVILENETFGQAEFYSDIDTVRENETFG
jgi:hypothetical protein